ncbi:MAG: hypothetical protein KatS3mg027_1312 [Bacteroidia bacterium]|nr:MAG: hypothetical protein KatS3mg027_1312 [Bacteroidia bacterium]
MFQLFVKYLIITIVSIDIVFDGEEVIKFPFLIQHYYEHQTNDKINFYSFFMLHYFNHQHSNSSDNHQHLPFKDHQNCAHIHIYSNTFERINISFVEFKKIEFPVLRSISQLLLNYRSIWHPPKRLLS